MEFDPKAPVNKSPDVPATPPFTSGAFPFEDTFFGPRDKAYQDRRVLELARLRGVDCYYYKLLDSTEDIDGTQPLSNPDPTSATVTSQNYDMSATVASESIPPVQKITRRSGNIGFYGEPVTIRERIDSTKREVVPDWRFGEPVLLQAVGLRPEREEEAGERGMIVTKKVTLHIPRALMEQAGIYPRANDVIRLPNLLDSFYDVKHVDRNTHRFGGFGFYTAFKFDLIRKTIFTPERKLQGE
jgi:hypothetical protein